MSNPLDDWARRARLLPAVLVETQPEAVRSGAEVLEREARANVLAATGGDMRLSRVRSGKGAVIRLAVRVDGAGRSATGVVVPTGPIMLVEGGGKAHRQPFVYTYNRRVKGRGQRPIRIPGVGIFARVNHPGSSGKQPVARAFAAAAGHAGEVGVAVFAAAARQHLGG